MKKCPIYVSRRLSWRTDCLKGVEENRYIELFLFLLILFLARVDDLSSFPPDPLTSSLALISNYTYFYIRRMVVYIPNFHPEYPCIHCRDYIKICGDLFLHSVFKLCQFALCLIYLVILASHSAKLCSCHIMDVIIVLKR